MELRFYSESDYALTVALETNPAVMKHLGGPVPPDLIQHIHEKRLAGVANGEWYFVIVPEARSPGVGVVGIWETSWEGALVHELGIMVLPEHSQARIGWDATLLVIARARAERAFAELHAFVGIDNRGTNVGVRRMGFQLRGVHDMDYEGRPMRSNHWVIDLTG